MEDSPPQLGSALPIIGWREWLALPDLGVARIKAKIDTGARSSALHAFDIERSGDRVRFTTRPKHAGTGHPVLCEADLLDQRTIKSSNGSIEERYLISTTVELLGVRWPIELTLTARDDMLFWMLLGREAIRGRFLVDPGASFMDPSRLGRPKKRPSTSSSSDDATP